MLAFESDRLEKILVGLSNGFVPGTFLPLLMGTLVSNYFSWLQIKE